MKLAREGEEKLEKNNYDCLENAYIYMRIIEKCGESCNKLYFA